MIDNLKRSPCYGCADRHLGCHSSCEKYEKFRERLDEIHKERDMETALNYLDTRRKLDAQRNEEAAYQRRKKQRRDNELGSIYHSR